VAIMEVASGTADPEDAIRVIQESFIASAFDLEAAGVAAGIGHDLLRAGRFPGWIDIAIAATALRFGEELVSRNERHFRRIRGLTLVTY